MMHDFRYVQKGEYQPLKNDLIELLHEVQDEVRDDFTFQYHFIGSTKRNMITRDMKSPIGFDFDIDLEINYDEDEYNAFDIRTILRTAITTVSRRYGFTKCEDSTRVITIKKTNPFFSTREHSCDFAIVNGDYYIHFFKEQQAYGWVQKSNGYKGLEKKADILKKNGYWGEVREVYIDKKNFNENPDKHSRSLYAETINEVYRRYLKTKYK